MTPQQTMTDTLGAAVPQTACMWVWIGSVMSLSHVTMAQTHSCFFITLNRELYYTKAAVLTLLRTGTLPHHLAGIPLPFSNVGREVGCNPAPSSLVSCYKFNERKHLPPPPVSSWGIKILGAASFFLLLLGTSEERLRAQWNFADKSFIP